MAEKAYDALADWFEYLNDDCGYEEWSQYLISLLHTHGAGETGLDIGCGSGYFTRKLQKAGYGMTGVDVSEAMLSRAQELSVQEGVRIPFVCADVAALRVPNRMDFAVALNDCFNYIPPERLGKALKRVYGALKKGALFFFDVSTEEKLSSLPPVSVDDRDEVTYLSFPKREGRRVTMEVSLFVRGKDGRYERRDETHTQYIYTKEELLSALAEAGFEPIFTSGHLGKEEQGAERMEFLTRRM